MAEKISFYFGKTTAAESLTNVTSGGGASGGGGVDLLPLDNTWIGNWNRFVNGLRIGDATNYWSITKSNTNNDIIFDTAASDGRFGVNKSFYANGSGQFIGTVSGADASNNNEFVTLGQVNTALDGITLDSVLENGNVSTRSIETGQSTVKGNKIIWGDAFLRTADGTALNMFIGVGEVRSYRHLYADNGLTVSGNTTITGQATLLGGADDTPLSIQSTDRYAGIDFVDNTNADTFRYDGSNGRFEMVSSGLFVGGSTQINGTLAVTGTASGADAVNANDFVTKGQLDTSLGNGTENRIPVYGAGGTFLENGSLNDNGSTVTVRSGINFVVANGSATVNGTLGVNGTLLMDGSDKYVYWDGDQVDNNTFNSMIRSRVTNSGTIMWMGQVTNEYIFSQGVSAIESNTTGTIVIKPNQSGSNLYVDGNVVWHGGNADLANVAYTNVNNNFSVGQTINSGTVQLILKSTSSTGNNFIQFRNSLNVVEASLGFTSSNTDFQININGNIDVRSNNWRTIIGGSVGIEDSGSEIALRRNVSVSGTTDLNNTLNFTGGSSGVITYNASAFFVRGASGQALNLGSNGSNDRLIIDTSGNIQISGSLSISGAYTMPTSDGTPNQVLTTNGSGNLFFSDSSAILPSNIAYTNVNNNFSVGQTINGELTVDSSTSIIRLYANGTQRGIVYANQSDEFGFLDGDAIWSYRVRTDASHEWLVNNVVKATLTSSAFTVDANTAVNGNLSISGAYQINNSTILFKDSNYIIAQSVGAATRTYWGNASDPSIYHDATIHYFRNESGVSRGYWNSATLRVNQEIEAFGGLEMSGFFDFYNSAADHLGRFRFNGANGGYTSYYNGYNGENTYVGYIGTGSSLLSGGTRSLFVVRAETAGYLTIGSDPIVSWDAGTVRFRKSARFAVDVWNTSNDGNQRLYFANGSHTYVMSPTDIRLRTDNNNVDKFIFSSEGNLTLASGDLAINSLTSAALRLTRSANQMEFQMSGSASGGWGIYDRARLDYDLWGINGSIAIGTTSANGYKFRVNGTTNLTGDTTVGGLLYTEGLLYANSNNEVARFNGSSATYMSLRIGGVIKGYVGTGTGLVSSASSTSVALRTESGGTVYLSVGSSSILDLTLNQINFRSNAYSAGTLTMNNAIIFKDNVWNTSADGQQRFYFATGSTTFIKAAGNITLRPQNNNQDPIIFYTSGNTTRMELHEGGVRRGSFYVDSSNNVGILDSDGSWAIKHTRDVSTEIRVNNSTYLTVNTSGISVVGAVTASSTVTGTNFIKGSARKYKRDITNLEFSFEDAKNVIPREYIKKADNIKEFGYVIDELPEKLQEVVRDNGNALDYDSVNTAMISALMKKVEELEAKLEAKNK